MANDCAGAAQPQHARRKRIHQEGRDARGSVVNLGISIPEGVSTVAAEEGLLHHVTLTAKLGVIGSQLASGLEMVA